ncbi:MAG: hypothetical protein ACLFWF_09110 [Alphaproteobacteria bacterium]
MKTVDTVKWVDRVISFSIVELAGPPADNPYLGTRGKRPIKMTGTFTQRFKYRRSALRRARVKVWT